MYLIIILKHPKFQILDLNFKIWGQLGWSNMESSLIFFGGGHYFPSNPKQLEKFGKYAKLKRNSCYIFRSMSKWIH